MLSGRIFSYSNKANYEQNQFRKTGIMGICIGRSSINYIFGGNPIGVNRRILIEIKGVGFDIPKQRSS
jgi:hypothetical protein